MWLHGEAVSAGIAMAAELSLLLGWIRPELVDRIKHLLLQTGLPIAPPQVSIPLYYEPGTRLLLQASQMATVCSQRAARSLPSSQMDAYLSHLALTETLSKLASDLSC